jgi:hypothetical protein
MRYLDAPGTMRRGIVASLLGLSFAAGVVAAAVVVLTAR